MAENSFLSGFNQGVSIANSALSLLAQQRSERLSQARLELTRQASERDEERLLLAQNTATRTAEIQKRQQAEFDHNERLLEEANNYVNQATVLVGSVDPTNIEELRSVLTSKAWLNLNLSAANNPHAVQALANIKSNVVSVLKNVEDFNAESAASIAEGVQKELHTSLVSSGYITPDIQPGTPEYQSGSLRMARSQATALLKDFSPLVQTALLNNVLPIDNFGRLDAGPLMENAVALQQQFSTPKTLGKRAADLVSALQARNVSGSVNINKAGDAAINALIGMEGGKDATTSFLRKLAGNTLSAMGRDDIYNSDTIRTNYISTIQALLDTGNISEEEAIEAKAWIGIVDPKDTKPKKKKPTKPTPEVPQALLKGPELFNNILTTPGSP